MVLDRITPLMQLIDLTHTFVRDMPVYPGDPPPELIQLAHLEKDGYNDHQIKTGMHVGTHIDAPLHMVAGGKRITEVPLEKFWGNGRLVDARGKSLIDADTLQNKPIERGDIVLVMTGFDKKYRDKDYFENYPQISEAFSSKLVKLGVSMLGIDWPSPDKHHWPIHKLLFQNNILIIENLINLEALLEVPSFQVVALPMKIDADAAPARVIALIP